MHHVDVAIADARRGRATRDGPARLVHEHALRELVRRQEQLVRLHARIESATCADRAGLWQQFFLCYDDFVMALHAAPRRRADEAPTHRAVYGRSSS